ncbi:DUF924 domain-containing protein [Dankookia rubra]|uniref:DUF924 domain-containing protein n=1 Tax=Dankookia rubra TaxID=1442381 RepID=A0A4R5QNZ3_9PROT|nr:DUF924 family protein [Dankookia rubra]TDH64538.1 DUF924 domain-containing protein [Dankookia rubra]
MQARDPIRQVLDAWFPPGLDQADTATHHRAFEAWFGGASPALPADLAAAALAGHLDAWGATAEGRLALILLLDQAPRGRFAGTPQAYAGDPDALQLAEEGLRNGHYDALDHPWEKTFFFLPLAHAEGPDLRERLIRVSAMAEVLACSAREDLRPLYRFSADQARGHRAVIARFGRYPHRNATLGRASTAEEDAYLASGELVHRRRPPLAARLGLQPAGG